MKRPFPIAAAMWLVSCSAPETLPPFQAPSASAEIFAVPPPAPVPPLPPIVISSPTDIGECVPRTFPHKELPVIVTLSGTGRVLSLEFYSQCSGERFVVSHEIAQCIRTRLTSWEWLTFDRSAQAAATEAGQDFLVAVRPVDHPAKRAAENGPLPFTGFGCGAGD